MKLLLMINDPPYGTERLYNALRLATNALTRHDEVELTVFLLGDAASGAKAGQSVPQGYYNVEKMLTNVVRKGGRVLVCGTCMDARGLAEGDLLKGALRSTMDTLTDLTIDADQVLVF
jgi:uncharacterized protein involved in oxidation of intracellular sulfur